MEEHYVGTQWVSSAETQVASGQGNSSMGARIPEANRASPSGIATNKGNRVPR